MAGLGLLVAPLCFAGFGAMALSMDRHHRDAAGAPCPPPLRPRLRRLGWGLLLTAAAAAVTDGAVGVVAGVLQAGLAAAGVVGLLVLRPRLLARVLAVPTAGD
jgi:hypothetical protein